MLEKVILKVALTMLSNTYRQTAKYTALKR